MIPTMQPSGTTISPGIPNIGVNGHNRVADVFGGVMPGALGYSAQPTIGYGHPYVQDVTPFTQAGYATPSVYPTYGIPQNPYQQIPFAQPTIGGLPIQPTIGGIVPNLINHPIGGYNTIPSIPTPSGYQTVPTPFGYQTIPTPFGYQTVPQTPWVHPMAFQHTLGAITNPGVQHPLQQTIAGIPQNGIANPMMQLPLTNPFVNAGYPTTVSPVGHVSPLWNGMTPTFAGIPYHNAMGLATLPYGGWSTTPFGVNPIMAPQIIPTLGQSLVNPAINPFIASPIGQPLANTVPFAGSPIGNPWLTAALSNPFITNPWMTSAVQPFWNTGGLFNQPLGGIWNTSLDALIGFNKPFVGQINPFANRIGSIANPFITNPLIASLYQTQFGATNFPFVPTPFGVSPSVCNINPALCGAIQPYSPIFGVN